MKPIKFRAWDKETEEMLDMVTVACDREVHWPPLYVKGGIIDEIDHQDYVLMQYTGLRDSKRTKEYPNGQEIYEGDIVRCYGGACLNGIHEYDYVTEVRDIRDLNAIIYSENVEVLGNKYENPGLLRRVKMGELDDKARLEEIKEHKEVADNDPDEYEFEKINLYNLHIDWLIGQAERVQKLEELVEGLLKVQQRNIDGHLGDIINQYKEETK